MRKPNWKQDSPRMQIATLLQSVFGHLHNMLTLPTERIKTPSEIKRLTKMCEDLSDAQEILRSEIIDSSWTRQNPKAITVADLPDQSANNNDRRVLHCEFCGAEYSANSRDYFLRNKDYEFECCGYPMELVTKRIIYISHI